MTKPAHLLRRRPNPRIRRRVAAAVTALLVLVIATAVVIATTQSLATQQTKDQQLGDTAQKAVDAADPIVRLCAGSDEVAQRLREVGACAAAQEVVSQPVAEPRVPERGPEGPGPTEAQIQAAVALELTKNPPADGRTPTAAEVTAIVVQVLSANPPAPGRTPTTAEIADAVQIWFAANPPAPGRDGRPPTAEEIQTAVAAELAAHPPPAGADSTVPGPPGPPVAEWSWPDPVVPMLTHTCTRSGGPDTAAIYSCS